MILPWRRSTPLNNSAVEPHKMHYITICTEKHHSKPLINTKVRSVPHFIPSTAPWSSLSVVLHLRSIQPSALFAPPCASVHSKYYFKTNYNAPLSDRRLRKNSNDTPAAHSIVPWSPSPAVTTKLFRFLQLGPDLSQVNRRYTWLLNSGL